MGPRVRMQVILQRLHAFKEGLGLSYNQTGQMVRMLMGTGGNSGQRRVHVRGPTVTHEPISRHGARAISGFPRLS